MIRIREGTVEEVHACATSIEEFKNLYQIEEFKKRLSDNSLILVAEKEQEVIGFKCGYQRDESSEVFYSWMGAVKKSCRKEGVATLLLEDMEKWCRQKGYRKLVFKTLNVHKGMLIFSIKHGFEIVDVISSAKDERKRIVLSKSLIQ